MKCRKCEEADICESCGKEITKHHPSNFRFLYSTLSIVFGIMISLIGMAFCLTIIGIIVGMPLMMIGTVLITVGVDGKR